ncbi:LON peptidase substrate-binding domain-containing protein [Aliidiomarina sp. B3213]|nr:MULTISPECIES: LON peptidase substrate-binding domain-containing protein [Gammaproteobacteria]
MYQSQKQIPLFPLSSVVLPGGRMKLRIYEPRSLSMVKEAMKNNAGFICASLNSKGNTDENTHIHPIGTIVEIVDFDALNDGMLGITVQGARLVRIFNITTDKTNLRRGDIEFLEHNSTLQTPEAFPVLVEKLKEVFEQFPELEALYPKKYYDDASWVCLRWLEILPLEASVKQSLLTHQCHHVLTEYIASLFEKEQMSKETE